MSVQGSRKDKEMACDLLQHYGSILLSCSTAAVYDVLYKQGILGRQDNRLRSAMDLYGKLEFFKQRRGRSRLGKESGRAKPRLRQGCGSLGQAKEDTDSGLLRCLTGLYRALRSTDRSGVGYGSILGKGILTNTASIWLCRKCQHDYRR